MYNFHLLFVATWVCFLFDTHYICSLCIASYFFSFQHLPHHLNYSLPQFLETGRMIVHVVRSSSAVIAVSAVSLLLIVTLTTVILTQCLLMIRMRKSKDVLHRNETCAEVMTSTTMHVDIPVTPSICTAQSG